MVVIEVGAHVDAPLDEVARRIRRLDERPAEREDVDRSSLDVKRPDEHADEHFALDVHQVGPAIYRVDFDDGPFGGTAVIELESVDDARSTVVDVRIELARCPLAVRLGRIAPGGATNLRRLVQDVIVDLLSSELDEASTPAVTRRALAPDPSMPASRDPEIRSVIRRSNRWLALAWCVVLVFGVVAAVAIGVWVERATRLDEHGEPLAGTVTSFGPDADGFDRVEVVATHGDTDVRFVQEVERTYAVGEQVVLLHDPDSGETKLQGEALVPRRRRDRLCGSDCHRYRTLGARRTDPSAPASHASAPAVTVRGGIGQPSGGVGPRLVPVEGTASHVLAGVLRTRVLLGVLRRSRATEVPRDECPHPAVGRRHDAVRLRTVLPGGRVREGTRAVGSWFSGLGEGRRVSLQGAERALARTGLRSRHLRLRFGVITPISERIST